MKIVMCPNCSVEVYVVDDDVDDPIYACAECLEQFFYFEVYYREEDSRE